MNRRSILSSLCTAALALLAPVAAWASRPRIKPREDLTPEQIAELKRLWEEAQKRETAARTCLGCGNYCWTLPAGSVSWDDWACLDCGTRNGSCATLRVLLAEAREVVARKPITFKQKDGTTRDYIIPLDTDADLLSRIDAVLKEKV